MLRGGLAFDTKQRQPIPVSSSATQQSNAQVGNLLGDLGDPSTAGYMFPFSIDRSPPIRRDPGLVLVQKPSLAPADFEKIWVASEISAVLKDLLKRTPTAAEMEEVLAAAGIIMMASSPIQNNTLKFFFYAQEVSHYYITWSGRTSCQKICHQSTKGIGKLMSIYVAVHLNSHFTSKLTVSSRLNQRHSIWWKLL